MINGHPRHLIIIIIAVVALLQLPGKWRAVALGILVCLGLIWNAYDWLREWLKRRRAKPARRWAATGRRHSLKKANLRGADLSGVDLGASEEGDKGANLAGADLRDSNLTSMNLSAANLRDANLSAANLRSANLRDADLRDTDLQWASLVGADLRGAKLEGCSLWHTKYDNATRWPEGFSPPSEAVNVEPLGGAADSAL